MYVRSGNRIYVNGDSFVLCEGENSYVCDMQSLTDYRISCRNSSLQIMSEENQNEKTRELLMDAFLRLNRKKYARMIDEFVTSERPWVKEMLNEWYDGTWDDFLYQFSLICYGIAHSVRNSWENIFFQKGWAFSQENIELEVKWAVNMYMESIIPPTPPKYKYLDKRVATEL